VEARRLDARSFARAPARRLLRASSSATKRARADPRASGLVNCSPLRGGICSTKGSTFPRIDTVLFCGPHESAIVFLQQLGRGLRSCLARAAHGDSNFIGQAHPPASHDLRLPRPARRQPRPAAPGQIRSRLPLPSRQAAASSSTRLPRSGCFQICAKSLPSRLAPAGWPNAVASGPASAAALLGGLALEAWGVLSGGRGVGVAASGSWGGGRASLGSPRRM